LKEYLLRGIQEGFRLSCHTVQPLHSAEKNMASASINPQPVTDYLQNEWKEGRIIGPFKPAQAVGIHIRRFGVIPKRHPPGKWCLILDLSHPPSKSVNGGIAKELSSVS
jgi:hypothetical protein